MTQNLRLVGSRTLTSADSDVTSNFTLTAPNNDTSQWCGADSASCINKSMSMYTQIGNATYYYYNFYAATAGTGLYSRVNSDAPSSICPKNWRLPSGAAFDGLYHVYGSNGRNLAYGPFGMDRAGAYDPATGSSIQSQGFYWTTKTGSTGLWGNSAIIDTDFNYSIINSYRFRAYSIRCVAR